MSTQKPGAPPVQGRGSAGNPPNRFQRRMLEADGETAEWERREGLTGHGPATVYAADQTRDVLSTNDSPDLPFRFSLNPYRGCEHGCIYCYARPTHEYLGFSAGLDFESRILVKPEAPRLLEKRLAARAWAPQMVALSGVTDGYQPIERRLELTRRCLEVLLAWGNPVCLITKNDLVLRDLDVLQRLADRNLVRVTLSVTTLDSGLARVMEPRAVPPSRRLEAIERLGAAGIPVGVNVAPLIPGLTDHEMPAILRAAAERGAQWAGYEVLRLPYGVEGLFLEWLEHHRPDRANRVIRAIQAVRGGRLSEARFGARFVGEGVRAEAVTRLFELTSRRLGLRPEPIPLSTEHFRRPRAGSAQGELFAE